MKQGLSYRSAIVEQYDIFKFGDIEYLKQTLEDLTLKFSKMGDFNDPFEMAYQYHHVFENVQESENWTKDLSCFYEPEESEESIHAKRVSWHPEYRKKGDLLHKVRQTVEDKLSNMAISCFSKTPYEPLMWAHYANNHKGICYCFESNSIFHGNGIQGGDVKYSNLLPKVRYIEKRTTLGTLEPQIEEIILTKSDNWSYEKEYRCFIESDELTHRYKPDALQAIILGCRTSKEDEEVAIALIEAYYNLHRKEVDLFYAIPSSNGFNMELSYRKEINPGTVYGHILDSKKDQPLAF